MTESDYAALIELSLEMKWADAAKFIRDEQGIGLRHVSQTVEALADKYPNSVLGKSFARRYA